MLLLCFQKLMKKSETLRAGGRSRCRLRVLSQARPKLPAERMGVLSFRPSSKLEESGKIQGQRLVISV